MQGNVRQGLSSRLCYSELVELVRNDLDTPLPSLPAQNYYPLTPCLSSPSSSLRLIRYSFIHFSFSIQTLVSCGLDSKENVSKW